MSSKGLEDCIMSVLASIKKFGLEQAFNYLQKDPEKNYKKLTGQMCLPMANLNLTEK